MFANIIDATEVRPLNKSDIRALDYVVGFALKKIFDTYSKEIILECTDWCSTWTQLAIFSWKGNETSFCL